MSCCVCGRTFLVSGSSFHWRKTCSIPCSRIFRKKEISFRIERNTTKEPNSGCWLWTGALDKDGYAKSSINGKSKRGHAISYEEKYGKVPDGLELDHKCRVRSCVNPDHLEPVESRENTMRSPICPSALNARKTHCKRGHKFDEENTHIYFYSKTRLSSRVCRTCRREAMARKAEEAKVCR